MGSLMIDIAESTRLRNHFMLIFLFGVFCIIAIVFIFSQPQKNVKFNYLDFTPLIFVLYIITIGDTNNSLLLNEKFIWFSVALLSFYPLKIVIKSPNIIKVVITIFVSVICYECLLGLLQLYKLEPSNFSGYVTGSFFNPALLGGFLATLFPFLLAINPDFNFKGIDFNSFGIIRPLVIPALFLVMLVLPVTLSRAAWLAVIAGTSYVLFQKGYVNKISLYLNRKKPNLKTSIIALILVLLLGALSGIYMFKKDSANGRLLIWKVTLFMWSESPLTGHGFDAVNAHYLNWQADYFKNHAHSDQEKMLAGNVHWSFNEILQTGAETGIIGVLLLFGWIGLLLFSKPGEASDKTNFTAAKGGIIALLTFGMFSYPFYSPILFFLLIIFAAILSVYSDAPWHFIKKEIHSKWFGISIPFICLALFSILVPKMIQRYHAYWYWDEANQLYNIEEYSLANKSFKEAYPELKANGKFLTNYGKSLEMSEDYTNALIILNEAQHYWSDEVLYNTLGSCYKAKGDFCKADEAFQNASSIIPHKFYPHYLMFKMYVENGEIEKAKKKAAYIKSKPVKIDSKALEEIFSEVKAFQDTVLWGK